MSVDEQERPQPRPGVLDIEAYVPGKSTAPGAARVFKLSANVAEETVRYIQGHEGDLLALRSLVTEPGQFSQCYMIQRRTQGTRRLILELTMPPLLYATTTTRPADKLEFEKLVGSGMTLTDALVEFAKRYPKGVKA